MGEGRQRGFDRAKKAMLQKLDTVLREGRVDPGAIPVINALNRRCEYYTTSSCEGRIQVIRTNRIGDKAGAEVLGKWHERIDPKDLRAALDRWDGKGYVYLMVQSPIFHVVVRDLGAAVELQRTGMRCGFKYSTIRSLKLARTGPDKITVELLSSLRFDMPLAHRGRIYPDHDQLEFLTDRANEVIGMCKERLARLADAFVENPAERRGTDRNR